jgi:cell division septal protein FtsQ
VATPALQLLPSGRSLAVGFALLAAALTLYLGARESSVFAVHSIDVTTEPNGHSRLVERSLAPLEGKSLLEVNGREISRRLEGLPHVHLLGFDRSFPNGLRVHVSVERPVAVLRRADENWLVSGEGRVLRKLDAKLRRPLPVVWLPRSTDPEIGTIIRTDEPSRAVAALATIRTAAPAFSNRIWYVKSGAEELTMVLRDDFELRLGTATDLPLKVKVAREVLDAVQHSGAAASYVDVAVPERPVAGTTLNSQIEP